MLTVSKSPPKWPGGGREREHLCVPSFFFGFCSRNWRASCALVFLFPTFPRMPLIVRCWLLRGRRRSLELITARRSPTSFSHPCGILGNKRYQLKVLLVQNLEEIKKRARVHMRTNHCQACKTSWPKRQRLAVRRGKPLV